MSTGRCRISVERSISNENMRLAQCHDICHCRVHWFVSYASVIIISIKIRHLLTIMCWLMKKNPVSLRFFPCPSYGHYATSLYSNRCNRNIGNAYRLIFYFSATGVCTHIVICFSNSASPCGNFWEFHGMCKRYLCIVCVCM